MKKSAPIKITIPQPCHESWDGMTPVHGGRHCEACSKVVTDFTVMTDRELVDYFKNFQSGCGRFAEGQLDRAIQPPAEVRHSWWVKMGIAAMVFVGLAGNSKAQKIKGQATHHLPARKKKAATPEYPALTADQKIRLDSLANTKVIKVYLKGAITLEQHEEIPSPLKLEPVGPQVTVPDWQMTPITVGSYFRPTRWQRLKRRIRTSIHPTHK